MRNRDEKPPATKQEGVVATGALSGVRVLDLSRVLAGPSCTQLLGDLGAEIIKIERPGVGDETRTWGPPYLRGVEGQETAESAYYLSCNRNKRSVTVDMSKPAGVALIKRLAAVSDVLVENFKVGGLDKLGLGYEAISKEFPKLIYCSITGYGQTGPYASKPGYDMMAQGQGGLISMTGEPDRPPVKVPVAVNDVMSGLNAAVGILAALHNRAKTGEGQHIDIALLDVQVGWLFNQGLNYLVGGEIPRRLGTAHPNSVPYQVFPTKDGWIIIAANNDDQWRRFCACANRAELIDDPRFKTNPDRVKNRDEVIAIVEDILRTRTTAQWNECLDAAGVPVGPVNTLAEVFQDLHVLHRGMKISIEHRLAGKGSVDLIGNPIKLSKTAVQYTHAPPTLGEHTREVLEEVLGLSASECDALSRDRVI
jgi:crotonobetainyl-CoA:carnitine CoA-transferase CaiB-like acyl-CoA transferase